MTVPHEVFETKNRSANKEPEWSSICNKVFDEFADTKDIFALEDLREKSSSDGSINLCDLSGSSDRSHLTDRTSPMPSWCNSATVAEGVWVEKQYPRPKEPVDFWTQKVAALEQSAAARDVRQQKLRATKSHPDFLSLGGFPSPPAIPASPTDGYFATYRRAPASGKLRSVTARSVSRGRPSGVTKSAVAGSVDPHATIRKRSVSPVKMMGSSHRRGGLQDLWPGHGLANGGRRQAGLRISPDQDHFSPLVWDPSQRGRVASREHLAYDDQLSPLTTTFQRARLHSPTVSSPHIESSLTPSPRKTAQPGAYDWHDPSLSETALFYPDGGPRPAPPPGDHFDFGFDDTPDLDPWNSGLFGPFTESPDMHCAHISLYCPEPFGSIDASILPSIEPPDGPLSGLGISCEPLTAAQYTSHASVAPLATSSDRSRPHRRSRQATGRPHTPYGQKASPSPSPPATEPRSSRRASNSRKPSRGRRAKSSHSTPRQPSQADAGGFVNFTPHDHGKILSGVAPSGSSKTKARREKEAADRRRRLSQAAAKAIVDAGGDLNALSKAGLI